MVLQWPASLAQILKNNLLGMPVFGEEMAVLEARSYMDTAYFKNKVIGWTSAW